MAEKKPAKVSFVIRGEIELGDGTSLADAMAHLKECEEKIRERATADVQVPVPRLTRVSLGSV